MFKGMVIVISMLAVLAVPAAAARAEESSFDFTGSLEVSAITQQTNDLYLLGSMYPATITPYGSGIKFRGDAKFLSSDKLTVKLRLGYQYESLEESDLKENATLDRAYLDYTPNETLSIRAGLQRLAWGTGYAWNPTDILDEPRNAFTDADNPEGIMALRTDLALGPVTGQFFVTPGDDWNGSGKALRFKMSPGGLDLTAGWVKPKEAPTAFIGDFAYSWSGVGLHGEALYQTEGNWQTGDGKVLNYLLGCDYTFPGGYYVALEYYHNDLAFGKVSDLIGYAIGHPGFGQDDLLGLANNGGVLQNHYFLRFTKTIATNLNTEIMLVYGPDDDSLETQPKLEYTWGNNLTIFARYLIINGQGQAEANLSPLKDRLDIGFKVTF
jgi:hypothetical protein